MENLKILKKILSIIDNVIVYRWSIVREIVDNYSSIEEIEKECFDYWYSYKFDLSKIETWSTYDNSDCISLKFYLENDKLYCEAFIWNGDNLYGLRKNLRFTAILHVPISFLSKISSSIEHKFEKHLSYLYEQHLSLQKDLWISNLKNELLT